MERNKREQNAGTSTTIKNDIESQGSKNRQIAKDTNLFKKFTTFCKNVTVEPLLAFYLMPGILARLAVMNLNLEKACRVNLNYSTELCDNISNQLLYNSTEEAEAHKIVALMDAWSNPVRAIIPCLLILFIGAWSDRNKRRKPCFMFPISGEIITQIGLIMCVYYFLEWPIEVAGFIESVPSSVTGGGAAVFLGVYSYMTDITTEEDRTFRIGVMNTFVSLATPFGLALSGILLKAIGFYGIFAISLGFHVSAFIYGYFRIHDIGLTEEEKKLAKSESKACGIPQFFDLRHVYNTFYVLVKQRQSTKRKQTILIVLAYTLLCGSIHGAAGYQYLYARISYHFDEVDFSFMGAFGVVVNFVGVMFAVTVFSKYLKMSDYMLAALGCITKVLASFVYAFAPNKSWFYLGPVVELFGGAAAIAMRSVVTKLVEPDEVGKINSLMGLTETAVNVIYGPIFAAFYAYTVSIYPGAFCLLGAALTLPTIIILLYLYKLQNTEIIGEGDKKKKEPKMEEVDLGYDMGE